MTDALLEPAPSPGQHILRLEPHHASTHTITVRISNGQGGVDVVGFDLVVTS